MRPVLYTYNNMPHWYAMHATITKPVRSLLAGPRAHRNAMTWMKGGPGELFAVCHRARRPHPAGEHDRHAACAIGGTHLATKPATSDKVPACPAWPAGPRIWCIGKEAEEPQNYSVRLSFASPALPSTAINTQHNKAHM